MIATLSPVMQALLGTLFTWFVTGVGAACVVAMPALGYLVGGGAAMERAQRKILDCALGFASGVMLAASFWSLLEPAVELASQNETYGESYKWIPPTVGFLAGALFIVACDRIISAFGIGDEDEFLLATAMANGAQSNTASNSSNISSGGVSSASTQRNATTANNDVVVILPSSNATANSSSSSSNNAAVRHRRSGAGNDNSNNSSSAQRRSSRHNSGTTEFGNADNADDSDSDSDDERAKRRRVRAKSDEWKRVLLLVLAVTVHNVPEGLAVGVGFGSVGKTGEPRRLALVFGLSIFCYVRQHNESCSDGDV